MHFFTSKIGKRQTLNISDAYVAQLAQSKKVVPQNAVKAAWKMTKKCWIHLKERRH